MPRPALTPLHNLLPALLLACSSHQHPLPTVLLVSGTPSSTPHEHTRRGLNPGDHLKPDETFTTHDDSLLVASYGPSGFALLPDSQARLIPSRQPTPAVELLEGSALLSYTSTDGLFPLITSTATLHPHTTPTYALVRTTPTATRLRIYQGSFLLRSQPVTQTHTLTLTTSSPPTPSATQEPDAENLPIGPPAFRLQGPITVHVSAPHPADLFLDDSFLARLPASFLLPNGQPHRLLVRSARHKDITTNIPPYPPPTVFWNPTPKPVAETDEALAPSTGPALAIGQTLVFATPPSDLAALDIPSRKTLWRTSLPSPATTLLPHSGHILLSTPSHIICLLADSGRILWTVKTTSRPSDIVTVADLVCYAEDAGLVHSRNLHDATLAWSFRTLKPPRHLVLLDSRTLLTLTDNGLLLALDPSTGTLLWQTHIGRTPSSPPPLPLDGRILIPCRDGSLVFVDRHRKTQTVRTGSAKEIRGLTATSSAIVVALSDGSLLGLDPGRLSRRWRRNGPDRPTLLTHGPQGHLYAGFADGTLMKLSATTGEPLQTATYPSTVLGVIPSGRETFVLTRRGLYTF